MTTTMKKIVYVITGLILILLGVVSSLFPMIPGFILVFFGVTFLAKTSKRIDGFTQNNKYMKKIRTKINTWLYQLKRA